MEEKENTKYLGSEKIGKLMLKFSIPCVLSLLVALSIISLTKFLS